MGPENLHLKKLPGDADAQSPQAALNWMLHSPLLINKSYEEDTFSIRNFQKVILVI